MKTLKYIFGIVAVLAMGPNSGAASLYFNGNAFALCNADIFNGTYRSNWTFEAWLMTPSPNDNYIFNKEGDWHEFRLATSNGKFGAFYGTDLPSTHYEGTPSGGLVLPNVWTAVALQCDGKNFQLFQDGHLVAQVNNLTGPAYWGSGASSINRLKLGMRIWAGAPQYSVSYLANVRISRVARYSGDYLPVTQYTPDTNTEVLLTFNEGVGNTAYDSSGNNNSFGLTNVQWSTNTPPQLIPIQSTFQPNSITSNIGDTVSFTVGVSNINPVIYQWSKDGIILAGQTNAILTITNVQPVNIGSYSVTVSDAYGNSVTSSNAVLALNGVNSGVWQGLVAYYPFNGNANDATGNGNNCNDYGVPLAQDRLGNAGLAYSFAGSGGTPTTTFLATSNNFPIVGNTSRSVSLWFRLDETPVYPYGNLISWGTDSTGSSFAIVYEPWQGHGYNFSINCNNLKWGWIKPGTIELNRWHHIFVSYETNLGSSQMYLDGMRLAGISEPSFGTPTTTINTDFGRLRINSYLDLGFGIFGVIDDVRIYNRALSTNDVAALYASEVPPPVPPNITQQPGDFYATAFNPASFAVSAYSFYPYGYQWQFNGNGLSNAMNSSLTITNARQSNVGQYTVVVTNAYGSVTSLVANLFLYPYLNQPFKGVDTYWGQTNTLSVGAWGSGNLAYQWYFNGLPLDGATAATLPLGAIQFTNAGQYSVVVSSSLGSVTNAPYSVVVNPAEVSLVTRPDLVIQGTVGYNYTVQSTVNLGDTNSWITETNITLMQPTQDWTDYNVDISKPNHPQKFYRVIPGQ